MKCRWPFPVRSQGAQEYPDIEFEDRIVDNMCAAGRKPNFTMLWSCPTSTAIYFPIFVRPGWRAGVTQGPTQDKIAVFEPVHGSAPKYAGKTRSTGDNPFRSDDVIAPGEEETARNPYRLAAVLAGGKNVTYDLGGMKTSEMTLAIIEKMG